MEITINIPQNNYVQPTEVRQEVVQAICTTLLEGHAFSCLHPRNDGSCRIATHYVATKNSRGGFTNYSQADKSYNAAEGYVRFHGSEVKAAFAAIIGAGYHIFRVYEYDSWMGYKVSKKPYMQGGTEVFEFKDFID